MKRAEDQALTSGRPRVGVSSCLMGERVRWDGDHKRQPFLAEALGAQVEWVPVCPEIEIGLGVPRAPIQLVREAKGLGLFEVESRRDLTETMRAWAAEKAHGLQDLDAFVLKHRSPSCGVSGARVSASLADLRPDGPFTRTGQGLFAEALLRIRSDLVIVEETDLEDAAGRSHFVERVFAASRLRDLLSREWSRSDLRVFLGRHDWQLRARSGGPAELDQLKALVEQVDPDRPADSATLRSRFVSVLAALPSRHELTECLLECVRELETSDTETAGRLQAQIRTWTAGDPAHLLADLKAAAQRAGLTNAAEQTVLSPDPRERAVLAPR